MRICFIGDSFVNGTGDDDCLGWVGRLGSEARRRRHDVTIYNLGVRGDTSSDLVARWQHEAEARLAPEHDGRLVFSFGVNDCVEGRAGQPRVAEDTAIANARSILTAARQWRPTLMVGPPCSRNAAVDTRVSRLSDRLAVLCEDLAIPFFATFQLTHGNAAWHCEAGQGDGIHPNRGGYDLLYGALLGWNAWREWVP